MPTCRRSHQIGETIQSLLAQTWTDFELLVCDDGDGRDGTADAVAAAAKGDPRVRYHRNPRKLGMPGNLNAGIMESQGDMIAVCHDHDLYTPRFLTMMIETLTRHPTALFVHCAIDLITQEGAFISRHIGDWPELSSGPSWLKFMLESFHSPVCALTLVRRTAHEHYGLYDPAYGFISDVEMWMRLARFGDVAYIRHPLIHVREREKDHAATFNGLSLLRLSARIHRQYLPYAYGMPARLARRLLLESRLLRQMVREGAAMIKHRTAHRWRAMSRRPAPVLYNTKR